ncbi:MAG: sodium:proton antiporter [Steroidobacteraceae bacterium]
MDVFEVVVALLLGGAALAAVARRFGAPYPALVALAGAGIALLPGLPTLTLDPELTLALFLAPVLLDAAFDTSMRDLKANWIPVTCLVLIAVGVTTLGVAWVARWMVPDLPWAAAIALGAIVAPPDAAAASAVLKQLQLPHRLLVILEGESLLNDASALLIYRLAVGAVAAGEFKAGHAIPLFALSLVGSVIAGFALSKVFSRITRSVHDPSSSIVLQFTGTFGVWILAEHLGLSAIVTIVVFAVTTARNAPSSIGARLRVPSYAVWDTVTFILNVLAFVLIGLQLRPIVEALAPGQRLEYFEVAGAVLATVVVIRVLWVALYNATARLKFHYLGGGTWPGPTPPAAKNGIVIGWCGMRGIVTLAAAYALPVGFPYRDLILLCSFFVVVGTLVVQGFTLRPLIVWLQLRDDREVDHEVRRAHERIARAALTVLDGDQSPESQELRREVMSLLDTDRGEQDGRTRHDRLRSRIVAEQRRALVQMRDDDEIGDDAFHQVEARLDWAELNAQGAE